MYTFGNLVIDTASHSVKVAGQEAPLTPKEFDLLVFLVNNKGIALSREKILQKVWNYDYYGEDRTVDTHVKMLRSHLGSCRGYIVTVWGVGYKFDPRYRIVTLGGRRFCVNQSNRAAHRTPMAGRWGCRAS